jgi:hypothetical protein
VSCCCVCLLVLAAIGTNVGILTAPRSCPAGFRPRCTSSATSGTSGYIAHFDEQISLLLDTGQRADFSRKDWLSFLGSLNGNPDVNTMNLLWVVVQDMIVDLLSPASGALVCHNRCGHDVHT